MPVQGRRRAFRPEKLIIARKSRLILGMKTDLLIRAELTGDLTCIGLGLTAHSPSPVLALCRKLISVGHHPNTPLAVYRGDVLCLPIASIGEAAELEVNGEGTGFRARAKPGRGGPMRPNSEAAE